MLESVETKPAFCVVVLIGVSETEVLDRLTVELLAASDVVVKVSLTIAVVVVRASCVSVVEIDVSVEVRLEEVELLAEDTVTIGVVVVLETGCSLLSMDI